MPALSPGQSHGGPWTWEGQLGARVFDHIPLSAGGDPASPGAIQGAPQVLQELRGSPFSRGPIHLPSETARMARGEQPCAGGAGCGARFPAGLRAAGRRGWASGAARARVPLRATSGLCEHASSHIPGQH